MTEFVRLTFKDAKRGRRIMWAKNSELRVGAVASVLLFMPVTLPFIPIGRVVSAGRRSFSFFPVVPSHMLP